MTPRDALAAALLECGLMRRYREYADHVETMSDDTPVPVLAREWSAAILAALDGWVLVNAETLAAALGAHPQDPDLRQQRAAAILEAIRGKD